MSPSKCTCNLSNNYRSQLTIASPSRARASSPTRSLLPIEERAASSSCLQLLWARAKSVLEIVARSFQPYQDVVRKLSNHGQLNPQPDIRRLAAGAARRLILLRFNDLQCPHEWRGTCHYPG